MKNYFETETKGVSDLMQFPYSNFKQFQTAIKEGDIVDIALPMDKTRTWLMEGKNAPKSAQLLAQLIIYSIFFLPVFYIIAAFVIGNYWLIPFAIIPVLVIFLGTPIARKTLPFHWILFIGLLIMWWIGDSFPDPIYWLPIILEYKGLDYLYKGSASIARQQVQKDEILLCVFWKYWGLTLIYKDGKELSQDYSRINNKITHNEDVKKEWVEFVESRKK